MFVLSVFSPSLRVAKWVGSAVLGVALSGCSGLGALKESVTSAGTMVSPYRIDIIQGNFVSREQAAAVSVGMSRAQVREILGTPLVSSVFHANRWDYVFTFSRQGQTPQQRRLTAFFKDDQLERIESDALPSETEFVASLDGKSRQRGTPVLTASDADLKAFSEQNKPLVDTPAAVPLTTNYPPLEPSVSGSNR